jgi:hypothetical protein
MLGFSPRYDASIAKTVGFENYYSKGQPQGITPTESRSLNRSQQITVIQLLASFC